MNKSSWIEVMGDTPYNKVLDFLMTQRGLFDYSKTEIAKESKTSWVSTQKIIRLMLKVGIVKKMREVGRTSMYMIDENNPIARAVVLAWLTVTKAMFDNKRR